MDNLLAKGIAAARAGEKGEARRILSEVLRGDSRNEKAWLWLSAVVESPRESLICLRNALRLNPHNPHARKGLRWAETRLAQARKSYPASPAPALPLKRRKVSPPANLIEETNKAGYRKVPGESTLSGP